MQNNTISLYGLSWRLNNRFFINPLIDVKNNRKEHKKQIIEIYKGWQNLPISVEIGYDEPNSNPFEKIIQKIDLITFDSNRIHINIIGLILPIDNNQDPVSTSSELWALDHLKNYKEVYDNYSKILICQENFNEKITKFLDEVRNHLKKLVQDEDSKKIELLMRFWLYKIFETNQPNTDVDYKLMDFNSIKMSEYEDLYNPYREDEDKIKRNLKTNNSELRRILNSFNKDVDKLNNLIKNFQISLKPITDDIITELKGSCPMERYLTYSYGIKSYFNRYKRSESK